ncbi:MAG: hypothetical protein D6706_13810 [Chloroflexi bacterium]|nr:MAG: hypothetical protein D6706_13810 [Chloroflexota bacterium]
MAQDKAHPQKTPSQPVAAKSIPLDPLTESARKSTVQLPVGEHLPELPPNIVQPATPAPSGNTQPAEPAPIQPGSNPAASDTPGDSSSDA